MIIIKQNNNKIIMIRKDRQIHHKIIKLQRIM